MESGDLGETLANAHKTYAAFRPEVAEYLFERGYRPLRGDPRLLEAIFRLQMESIGNRGFGVSNDAWRDNREWPDRYFPILWIELVPKLLPRLPADRALASIVLLFNLGENLVTVAPTLGGAVAEALLADVEGLARDVPKAVVRALANAGVVPADEIEPPGPPTMVKPIARISLAAWDPQFIPHAVGFDGDAFYVADALRPIALRISRSGQLLGRLTLDRIAAPAPCIASVLCLAPTGDVSAGGQPIGRIDLRGMAAAAIGPRGSIVISRRFSQAIELWSAQ